MINSKSDLEICLSIDSNNYKRVIYDIRKGFFSLFSTFRARYFTTPISDQIIIWQFIKTLRRVEYYANNPSLLHSLCLLFYLRKYVRLGRITGFQIPINCIGKGLTIWHYGTIIINQDTKIGDYCTLRPDIVIGHKDSSGKSPIIGNNVTINSGARIIGDIVIGDDVIVAPNAVITHDVPSHSIVGGIPARILKKRSSLNEEWQPYN